MRAFPDGRNGGGMHVLAMRTRTVIQGKTDFAISRPTVVIVSMLGPSESWGP